MSLLLLLRGSGSATGLDVGLAVSGVVPWLGAATSADLTCWTEAELYQFADEAAKRLARRTGLLVVRSTAISIVSGTPAYDLPTRHLSTIHVSLGVAALRPATAMELEARDNTWVESTGTPDRWLEDQEGLKRIRVWKQPTASGSALPVVHHQYPPEITSSARTIDAPPILEAYFALAVLGEARGKESKCAMPEVSQWARALVETLDAVLAGYYGGAE